MYPAPPVTDYWREQGVLDVPNWAFQEPCQQHCPGFLVHQSSHRRPQGCHTAHCAGPVAAAKPPCHKLKVFWRVLSSPAHPRGSSQDTLFAMILPGGTEAHPCVAPRLPQHSVWTYFPWQLKHIYGRDYSDTNLGLTILPTMPFAAAFILVFKDNLFYMHISKKNSILKVKSVSNKESIPSCSSPKRHTIHFSLLSAACHFVSSTDCWTVFSL